MKRALFFTFNIIFYIGIFLILISSIGSQILQRPFIFTVIQSNSMYPLFERGDIVFVDGVGNDDSIDIGQNYIFYSETGQLADKGWIFHRVIEGNDSNGYITKGDNNDYTDQSYGSNGAIKREWIKSKSITVNENTLALPKAGYITLWLGQFISKAQSSQLTIPIFLIVITLLIAFAELMKRPQRRKKTKLGKDFIYIFGGLTFSILLCGIMLANTQLYRLNYGVSENAEAALMGSDIGIIKKGTEKTIPLPEIYHESSFPITLTMTSNDQNFEFSHSAALLRSGTTINPTLKVKAVKVGQYSSKVYVGYLLPLLPKEIIYKVSSYNYWLAILMISLLPGLPITMYPFLSRKTRRNWKKEIRRKYRRIRQALPV
ncbi:signal peptidase I [Mesobacillus subterraneus]|uniref:signal peptidase I n=1 Tax=Mesobacillus subterraneus TaxID=285983 RepID=UPI001CFEE06D|nr:signal peptidase I [Mesobacillus subterraneus]WLR55487.1 signal peptidase I [Mesobacillus subterraneus]